MSLNQHQYEALFTNAFGAPSAEFGVEIDTSSGNAIGKAGAHTIELLVLNGRAIDWRVDGDPIVVFERTYKRDDPRRTTNGGLLRSKL